MGLCGAWCRLLMSSGRAANAKAALRLFEALGARCGSSLNTGPVGGSEGPRGSGRMSLNMLYA